MNEDRRVYQVVGTGKRIETRQSGDREERPLHAHHIQTSSHKFRPVQRPSAVQHHYSGLFEVYLTM